MSFLSRDFDETAQAQQESVSGLFARVGALWLQIGALILLSIFPVSFLRVSDVGPTFLLMAVYYWTIFSPHRLSPLMAFLAGLVMDLLSGGPLGLGALTLVAMQRATSGQRKFLSTQPFLVVWLGFALVCAASYAVQWSVVSLFEWRLVPPRPMLAGAGLSALFFPPLAWLLAVFGHAGGRGRGG